MASSGSNTWDVSGTSGYLKIRMSWAATQSVSNNYSDVTVKVYVIRGAYGYNTNSTADAQTLWIDGVAYNGTSSVGGASNTESLIMTQSRRVYHNSDGTKTLTLKFEKYFGLSWGGVWLGTRTFPQVSYALDTIARATNPVLSNTNPTMGDTITISLPRASETFTHYVFHDFWEGKWTRINDNAVGSSLSWQVPLEEYAIRIPSSTSGGGRIQVDTYNGSVYIGSKIVNFTAHVPSTAIPILEGTTSTEVNSIVSANLPQGTYLKNMSTIRTTFTGASGVLGSTIAQYRVYLGGSTYGGLTSTVDVSPNTHGAITMYTSVIDSRGRESVKLPTATTILDYEKPLLSEAQLYRKPSDSTILVVDSTGTYYNLSGVNEATLNIYVKPKDSTIWDLAKTVKTSTGNIGGVTEISGYIALTAYDIMISLFDEFTSSSPNQQVGVIGTTTILYSYDDTGFSVGKVREPTDNPFQVSKDATFEANVHVQGQVTSDTNPTKYLATLQGGWVNYGDGFAPAEYWKGPDNQVHLHGLIKSGTIADGTVIFTLPEGFRPLQKEIFIVFISGGGFGRVDVNDNGNVVAKIVNATYTSLSGISFLAES